MLKRCKKKHKIRTFLNFCDIFTVIVWAKENLKQQNGTVNCRMDCRLSDFYSRILLGHHPHIDCFVSCATTTISIDSILYL